MGWGECYDFLVENPGWHSYQDLVESGGLSKNQALVGLGRCKHLDDVVVSVRKAERGGKPCLLFQYKGWIT